MKTSVIDTTTLDIILNTITSDDKKNGLLDVIYANDLSIERSDLIKYIRESMNPISTKEIEECINLLDTVYDHYAFFLVKLREKLVSQIVEDLGKDYNFFDISSIDNFTFWAMFAIAVKKCIGSEYANTTLSPSTYFSKILINLNQYQKNAHDDCITSFNMDANTFTLKNTPDLRLFLHSFHSNNKTLRTRKKNLHRVERRVKKMVQVSKLAHNGKSKVMFSNGRYMVPEQFATIIENLYIS